MHSTILIADADETFALGLATLLRSVGLDARTGAEPQELAALVEPDRSTAIVLGMRARGASVLEVVQELRSRHPHVPVILVAEEPDVPTAVKAIKAGAFDVLVRPLREQSVLDVVWAALRHEARCGPLVREIAETRTRVADLTDRERQVLDQVAQGAQNKRIAADLGISQKTVEAHRCRILAKLGCDTMAGLMSRYALVRWFGGDDAPAGIRPEREAASARTSDPSIRAARPAPAVG